MRVRTKCSSLGDCSKETAALLSNCFLYLLKNTCLFDGVENFEARVCIVRLCLQEVRICSVTAPHSPSRAPESSGVRLSAPSCCAAPGRVAESTAVCACVYSLAVWACVPGPACHCGVPSVWVTRAVPVAGGCWPGRHSPWHGGRPGGSLGLLAAWWLRPAAEVKLPVLLLSALLGFAPCGLWELRSAPRARLAHGSGSQVPNHSRSRRGAPQQAFYLSIKTP